MRSTGARPVVTCSRTPSRPASATPPWTGPGRVAATCASTALDRFGPGRGTVPWTWPKGTGLPLPGLRQGRRPRGERGDVTAAAVQVAVPKRVLGLHQLVDLRRPLVD